MPLFTKNIHSCVLSQISHNIQTPLAFVAGVQKIMDFNATFTFSLSFSHHPQCEACKRDGVALKYYFWQNIPSLIKLHSLYYLELSIHLTIITMSRGEELEYVINNGRRYEVTIPSYFKEQDYIIYEAVIFDTAFALTYPLYFRFKTLKKLHQQMMKQKESDNLPEFPRTKSFALWNKTNEDPKLIQDRIRDLEYYLTKLLNIGQIQKLQEIRYIQKSIRLNKRRRTCSYDNKIPKSSGDSTKQRLNECPQFYKKQRTAINLL